jgi:hypothetical protein
MWSTPLYISLKLLQPLMFILQVEMKTHYNLDAQLEFCRPVALLTWLPHGSVVTPYFIVHGCKQSIKEIE